MFFDVDTHIDETEATWVGMPEELVPRTLLLEADQAPPWLKPAPNVASDHCRFWLMDGQLRSHRFRSDEITGTTLGTRTLTDVAGRLADMDSLGVDVQCIFPTLFIKELTHRPELDIALCASYNRWIAERCAESKGRLRWIAVLPYSSIPDAVAEMHRAKQLGACGILKRGIECDRSASDEYFWPIYGSAEDLDLPICIHSSSPWTAFDPNVSRIKGIYGRGFFVVTVLQAFHALAADKIPERFPTLRFGFIEAGSVWVPYVLDMLRIHDADNRRQFLEEHRFFVTCELEENLPYVINEVGDSQLMVGTDYSHGDRSGVMNAHQGLLSRVDISDESAREITTQNGCRFYNLGA